MGSTYELWDVAAGNVVGSFPTRGGGLDVVRILLDTYGREYANDLSLSYRDADGSSWIVAMGERLLEMVDSRASEQAGGLTVSTPSD